MSIYATSPDQVILSLLWRIRDITPYRVSDLTETINEFQKRTGLILYGSVREYESTPNLEGRRQTLCADLDVDLAAMEERHLISRDEHGLKVSVLAAPVASALVLPSPFLELEHIVRERISTR